MPLSKHKTIYISSKDRVSGNKNKFSINLAELLWDLEPDSRDPQISRVDVSVDNLWVPFKKGSGNRQTRTPQVFLDSNMEPPPIRLLRLKSNIPQSSMTSTGYSNTILQFPFMEHYKESEPTWDESLRDVSHVSYTAQTDTHNGRFTLLHGPQASLGQAEFALTDELDRLVNPFKDWYITLTLWCETCPDKTFERKMDRMIDALQDTNERLDTLILLSLMQEQNNFGIPLDIQRRIDTQQNAAQAAAKATTTQQQGSRRSRKRPRNERAQPEGRQSVRGATRPPLQAGGQTQEA